LEAPRTHLKAPRSRIKQTVATFPKIEERQHCDRDPKTAARPLPQVDDGLEPYPLLGYLTRVIHISRKEESKVVVVVVVVVVVKEETSYRCEKISRKEEGRRAGRGYLYPANRARIRANPDLVRACEIEVNEQMGLQHSC